MTEHNLSLYFDLSIRVIEKDKYYNYLEFRKYLFQNSNLEKVKEVFNLLEYNYFNHVVNASILECDFLYFDQNLLHYSVIEKVFYETRSFFESKSNYLIYKESIAQYYFSYLSLFNKCWYLNPVFKISKELYFLILEKVKWFEHREYLNPIFIDEIIGESNESYCLNEKQILELQLCLETIKFDGNDKSKLLQILKSHSLNYNIILEFYN